ncbi:MAG: NADH-quinone oxidoreductase subunit C [Pseudomonadota bacterium]
MSDPFVTLTPGQPIARSELPRLSTDAFLATCRDVVSSGGQVVQFFGFLDDGAVQMVAVLRTDVLRAACCEAPPSYPSLTTTCPAFHLFERELAEQFGIRPEGHPWLKMVRYHPNVLGREDLFGNDYAEDIPGRYPSYQVAGDEVHEVAVGPVHAGVIEPGHFRFNCVGERVLHLEIQLGYQHRGVEAMLRSIAPPRIPLVVESIVGDSAVASSLCLSQAVEGLMGLCVPREAQRLRTVALELERLANHVGDLGALSGDVAFVPPQNYFGRMRGELLNMTLLLASNRFGKGLVRPGGLGLDCPSARQRLVLERLQQLRPQLEHVIELLFGTPSVRARFEECGRVSTADARALGLVGPAGRASGLPHDVRRSFGTELYPELMLPDHCETSGDVYARARIRADEILQSVALVERLLGETTSVDAAPLAAWALAPSSLVVTLHEAWRGELSHCLITDESGSIAHYKIKDPSFHNWSGLALALRDTGISDFPLNNKSFNLSYCGHDL